MDRNDRQAIEDLFDKLATVERQSPQRDAELEAFIRDKIARQPGAPYYMAQTIVVQERRSRRRSAPGGARKQAAGRGRQWRLPREPVRRRPRASACVRSAPAPPRLAANRCRDNGLAAEASSPARPRPPSAWPAACCSATP